MRGKLSIFAGAGTTALILSATAPAAAQSANTWSLPDPSATPTGQRAQGPVDAQNPVVRPSTSAPEPVPTIAPPPPTVRPMPVPSATATPSPRPTPRATPTAAPSTAPVTPRATATPTPEPTASTPVQTAPSPSASPVPEAAAPVPTPAPSAAPILEPASTDTAWPTWWWAAPMALVAAIGGVVALTRRRSRPDQVEWEAEEAAPVAAPVPQPSFAPPPPPPAPVPQPAPVASAPSPTGPELAFEPVGLRLSLVYATLQYRLTVTATAPMEAGHLLGDMIGAHGSIPPEEQLAPAIENLTPLKPVPALAAGESATISGEILLPLNAITPVRQNSASLFVPLVRLCLVSSVASPAVRRVYTVGTAGSAALTPLRLDVGPGEHRTLAAREVEAARAYPVQSARLQQAVG
ncbi:hypothetical protein [Novosphingobium kaempferiae]|uniref:hypothetical protein n=1 Tax=Novosphingobium kaempferiae TaxID=2896849 RepID=UPI001E4DF37E|nr:hypothetical protein [Novosphingobium kaempferiae]